MSCFLSLEVLEMSPTCFSQDLYSVQWNKYSSGLKNTQREKTEDNTKILSLFLLQTRVIQSFCTSKRWFNYNHIWLQLLKYSLRLSCSSPLTKISLLKHICKRLPLTLNKFKKVWDWILDILLEVFTKYNPMSRLYN
jgi:hypothetical protein